MLHNGEKRKPLNCIFYFGWPVQFDITTINLFPPEGLYTLASIFISYTAPSIFSFHYWSNSGWLIYFNRDTTYAINILIILLFIIEFSSNIGRMRNFIYHQVIQCVWCGGDCGDTCHDFIWILCLLCMNSIFLPHLEVFPNH